MPPFLDQSQRSSQGIRFHCKSRDEIGPSSWLGVGDAQRFPWATSTQFRFSYAMILDYYEVDSSNHGESE